MQAERKGCAGMAPYEKVYEGPALFVEVDKNWMEKTYPGVYVNAVRMSLEA